jgi:alginate O-acetyltransferase complex protein AlgI
MTLGGLWHGAGATFVAWGLVHGIGLCIALLWRNAGLPMSPIVGWPLTFLFVVFAWVLFRAQSFDAALNVYAGLIGSTPIGPPSGRAWTMILIAAVVSVVGPASWNWVQERRPSAALAAGVALLAAVALVQVSLISQQQFIYFQF